MCNISSGTIQGVRLTFTKEDIDRIDKKIEKTNEELKNTKKNDNLQKVEGYFYTQIL